MYVAVTERQATLTQVFSYGRVYLHFYEIKTCIYNNSGLQLFMTVDIIITTCLCLMIAMSTSMALMYEHTSLLNCVGISLISEMDDSLVPRIIPVCLMMT